jgi:hypothetical protein
MSTRHTDSPIKSTTRARTAPYPEPIPDFHCDVDLERNGRSLRAQRPERLDAWTIVWAVRPSAEFLQQLRCLAGRPARMR